jgi:nucleoside 2-deoxyribosyltransferase
VAISGQYGTLSEIAYALSLDKPVVGYGTWDIKALHKEKTISEVINRVKELLNGK